MLTRLVRLALLLAAVSLPSWPQRPAQPPDNSELKQIYDADQKDVTAADVDWSQYRPRAAARRRRVRELLDQGKLLTGKDYEHAAGIFQHGAQPDDFLLAHILAVTAVAKGASSARYLCAATLDRYLQRIGQPQVFGTQFLSRVENAKELWKEPYNRTLLPPALRDANCVPDPEDQFEMLKAYSRGETPGPPKRLRSTCVKWGN